MVNLLNKQRYFLIFIFVIAFSLRAGYALLERITPYIDAVGYDKIGRNIAEGKGYRTSSGLIENDDAVRWPPGYPLFLGIIYKLFGQNYPVVWILQSIISAFICILIYLIANKLFERKVAYISAIISALCFNLVIYPAMLISETLFLLLVLLYFIYTYKADTLRLNSRYLVAGIFASLATLTRPIVLIFPLFFSLISFKKNKKGIAIFLFPIVLFISIWMARNYYIYQRFIPIGSGQGEAFWIGHHLKATGKYELPEQLPRDPSIQEYFMIDNSGYLHGAEFIVKHPMRALLLELKKISLFFSLIRSDGWWLHMRGIDRIFSLILSILFNLLIFGLGIPGIVFSYASTNKYISWMRRFIYVSILSLIPFVVEARYRLTIYPFMIIFAGYAIILWPKIRLAFISQDKQIIRLSRLSLILFILLIFNSFYDLSTCMDQIALRLYILKSGVSIPW